MNNKFTNKSNRKTLTYWSISMNIQSIKYGFIESYLKTNVIEAIQIKSVNLPIPSGVTIKTIEDFKYSSNIILKDKK